ncbi:TDP-N-acetylfucosamine:lipid II N-acetylfucosaminyltransferase [Acinetobacter sp. YH1901136]|uniref:TDP-N-acetylfucosamine:lipid II N-acetylfucosaminyltransferase n=1 Tax=Acinetobacter sp. YH1901136 TaxID=2601200 RepID=UPI0015D45B98
MDDSFTDIALQYFEKVSPQNNIVIKFGGQKFKKFNGQCFYLNKKEELLYTIQNLTYDLIVLHALNGIWFNIIENKPEHLKVVWIGWGYDYYDLFSQNILLEKTDQCVNASDMHQNLIRYIYAKTLKPLITNYRIHKKRNVIRQIDYFAPVLEEEYGLFEKALPNQKIPEYIGFNYGVLENDLVKGFENRIISGNDILLGNSSSATCNHIEALELLSVIDLQNKTVICPLSYGDVKYQKKICAIGKQNLQSNFKPLLDLLPIEEYISTVLSCGNVIMNHVRQQAVGNIVLMLYLGAKVFLRQENPVYQFLKQNNFIVYLIDDIKNNPMILDKRLSQEDIEKNRSKLRQFWSEDVIMNKTRNIISLAE